MQIQTTRFGILHVDPDTILTFPNGILGLGDCRHWVLLADAHNDALAWLQSTTHADVALAVVSPRRYVSGYQVRVARSELKSLDLHDLRQAEVLVIVSRNDFELTLNLKAPLVINPQQRLGRQVISNADQSVQYPVQSVRPPLRKSA
jgi:flagellar assembly factor FliW